MNPLIDQSYFNGVCSLPKQQTAEPVATYIIRSQRDVLLSLLGSVLYADLLANETDAKWQALLYGDTYTVDVDGISVTVTYGGIVNTTDKSSIIALHAFCRYMYDTNHAVTTTGVVNAKNQNSISIGNKYKIVPAWNEFVQQYGYVNQDVTEPSAYNFLRYSAFDFDDWFFKEFEPITTFD